MSEQRIRLGSVFVFTGDLKISADFLEHGLEESLTSGWICRESSRSERLGRPVLRDTDGRLEVSFEFDPETILLSVESAAITDIDELWRISDEMESVEKLELTHALLLRP